MNTDVEKDSLQVDLSRKDKAIVIDIQGRLASETVGQSWDKTVRQLKKSDFRELTVNAGKVTYCDGSGAAFIIDIKNRCRARDAEFKLNGLKHQFVHLIELIDIKPRKQKKPAGFNPGYIINEIGKAAGSLFSDIIQQISFLGEIAAALWYMFRRPTKLRWKDFFITAEKAGANAVGIITMLGFLVGLILAFQSAIPLKRFGAQVYVADLVSISVIRELGPLITAIILAGRTGSAFAAELGTMKINEEIDALKTMGIDPVRFLATTRMCSAILVTPVLTLFANLFAIIGCGVVMVSLGFPLQTFFDRMESMVSITDFAGGMAKSFVFGFLVAAVGCLRGFQTQSGATAVGNSATRAVVSGIILIIAADGIFAVVYYYLGI